MARHSRHIFHTSLLLICLVISLAFLRCSNHSSQTHQQHFIFNQSTTLNSLDPVNAVTQAEIWAVGQFYNGLVQTDSNMAPVPCIADRWEISADGMSYTFHLRDDVYFNVDGCFAQHTRRCRAADVVFSFQRLLDPATAAKGSWVLRNRLDARNPFTIIDDTTLVIKLSKPFTPFINILTMPYCYIIPHEAIEYYGADFMKHPVGTGPFGFYKWVPNEVLIGRKNKTYFEKDNTGATLPYLDGFSMTQVENKKTEYLKFIQGDIDMMADIDAAFKDELLDAKAELKEDRRNQFVLLKNTFLNTEYIGFQTQDSSLPILRNVLFRQALAASIDKAKMLLYLRNNVGHAAQGGYVPDGINGFGNKNTYGIAFNIRKAQELLQQSGYKQQKIALSVSTQNQALAEYIVKAWQDIGVKARLDVLQSKSFRDKMVKGKVQVFRGSWIADYADPESFLACMYGANGAPPNYAHYKNTVFDKLYDMALQTTDNDKRRSMYRVLDSIAAQDAAIIPLFYDQSLTFMQKNIKGLRINALDMIDLRYVKKVN